MTLTMNPVETLDDHAISLFGFLLDKVGHQENQLRRCALVTIIDFNGPSSRRLGAHMVVCDDGEYAGSVSSGCFDQNVALMAMETLKTGQAKRVKLGEGSEFIDMKLPCGGGMELLIQPDPDRFIVEKILRRLKKRRAIAAYFESENMGLLEDGNEAISPLKEPELKEPEPQERSLKGKTGWFGERFIVNYMPKIRLMIAGRGPELIICVKIAMASGFEVIAYSPDQDDLDKCAAYKAQTVLLSKMDEQHDFEADGWSAFCVLFHEHEWEPALLKAAMQSDVFYIGALGSRATHQNRIEVLKSQNICDHDISRIYAPIGVVSSMRSPSFLAVSVLAEIISVYHKKWHSP